MHYSNRVIFFTLFILGFHLIVYSQETPGIIKNLTRKADIILTGKVSHKISEWNESKSRIYTRTTVQVVEYLKGDDRGHSIEIVTLGGEVGDVGEVYSHMPKFMEDEEVLVFLEADVKTTRFRVLNGEEGKISVTTGRKTKENVTRSNKNIKDLKSQIKRYLNEQ